MHPLKHPRIIHVDKIRICVPVKRQGRKLTRDGNIAFSRTDTLWAELPLNYKVLTESGEEVKPSGKFLITVESIDPYHLVTDYHENNSGS